MNKDMLVVKWESFEAEGYPYIKTNIVYSSITDMLLRKQKIRCDFCDTHKEKMLKPIKNPDKGEDVWEYVVWELDNDFSRDVKLSFIRATKGEYVIYFSYDRLRINEANGKIVLDKELSKDEIRDLIKDKCSINGAYDFVKNVEEKYLTKKGESHE